MTMTTFRERIAGQVQDTRSVLCIGLDSDIERLPSGRLGAGDPQVAFNRAIIDATVESDEQAIKSMSWEDIESIFDL